MNNKNTWLAIGAVVIVVGLGFWAFDSNNSSQAPSSTGTSATTTGTNTSSTMVTNPLGAAPQTYQSTVGFSIQHPSDYTVDTTYSYQELGVGKEIAGVKFTIPASLAAGTNLSPDTYISVEQIPKARVCTADLFLDPATLTVQPHIVVDDGVTYSMAVGDGAAAGNRYEETVYAVSSTNPCVAVRYFVHYGVLANYPTSTGIVAYNSSTLIAQFDAIRRTLVIN